MHRRALQLDRGVLERYREVRPDADMDLFEDPQCMGRFEALLPDDDVRREDRQIAPDR